MEMSILGGFPRHLRPQTFDSLLRSGESTRLLGTEKSSGVPFVKGKRGSLELSWRRLVEDDDKHHDKYYDLRVSDYHFNGKIVGLGYLVVDKAMLQARATDRYDMDVSTNQSSLNHFMGC